MGTLNGAISRLTSISDSGGTLESYEYLGSGTVVQRTQGNGVKLTYIKQSGESNGGGDPNYGQKIRDALKMIGSGPQ